MLSWQPSSEWATPSFIWPKKNCTLRYLFDFVEISKRIVRKTSLLQKNTSLLQELEGLTFAPSPDLNMEYFTIRWDPGGSKIYSILFPWCKYSYLRLPMGIAGHQIKLSKHVWANWILRVVCTYLNDLSIIPKANLVEHLEKLRLVLTIMQNALRTSQQGGLKSQNLGYKLIRDGI